MISTMSLRLHRTKDQYKGQSIIIRERHKLDLACLEPFQSTVTWRNPNKLLFTINDLLYSTNIIVFFFIHGIWKMRNFFYHARIV